MKLAYKNKKLEKLATSAKELTREFGPVVGKAAMIRMAMLVAAPNLEAVPTTPPASRHKLIGDRKGEWSVTIKDGDRICVVPDHNPLPLKPDGDVDLKLVTAVTIVFIGDYHP